MDSSSSTPYMANVHSESNMVSASTRKIKWTWHTRGRNIPHKAKMKCVSVNHSTTFQSRCAREKNRVVPAYASANSNHFFIHLHHDFAHFTWSPGRKLYHSIEKTVTKVDNYFHLTTNTESPLKSSHWLVRGCQRNRCHTAASGFHEQMAWRRCTDRHYSRSRWPIGFCSTQRLDQHISPIKKKPNTSI